MELTFGVEEFDRRAAVLADEIVQRVRFHLWQAGLPKETLEECVAKIAMSMATLLDDLAGVETGGMAVRPYLTFRLDDDRLLHCGENSNVHEFIYSALNKAFG